MSFRICAAPRHPAAARHPAICRALLAGLLLPALPALATTYSVGAGPGCSHASLSAAIVAAVADASPGPHLIKIALGSRTISNYQIVDPIRDINLEGGYAACTDSVPASGQRTTLTANQVAGSRVLRINNNIGNERRVVSLRRLTITGGLNPSSELGWGGGIHVSGRVNLNLFDGTYVDANSATNGGGIALFNLTSNPDLSARLLVSGSSRVCNNSATGPGTNGNGGGIYALGGTEVTLWSGWICGNDARRHGGGLFLGSQNDSLVLDPTGPRVVDFSDNSAGGASFAANEGFGGAIYSFRANIVHGPSVTNPMWRPVRLIGNSANFGGALYLEGSAAAADGFTAVELRNAEIGSNTARGRGGAVHLRNAVDLRLVKSGAGSCTLGALPWPCVDLYLNESGNETFSSTLGGGGFAFLEHDPGAPRPALRVAGAVFESNKDPNGTAAVVDARGDSSVRILRSVFIANSAGGVVAYRTLIEARTSFLFAYNTVLLNGVTHLLFANGATTSVRTTGSILHSPGSSLITGGGSMVHDACLLAHTDIGVPAGVKVVAWPRLGPSFAPRPQSGAIDTCTIGMGDTFWPAGLDAYGESAPVDIASIANDPGPWDLGAVEQRDVLFYGGFGFRPGN